MATKRLIPAVAVPSLFGVLGLFEASRDTDVRALASINVVFLVTCGVCFGVALVNLIHFLRGRRGGVK